MPNTPTNNLPAGAQQIGTLPGGVTAFVGGNTGPVTAPNASPAPTRGANGTLYQNTDQTAAAITSRTNPHLPGAPKSIVSPPPAGVISTSDPATGAVNNLGEAIGNAKANPITVPGVLTNPGATGFAGYDTTAAQAASDAYVKNLEARKKELAQERDAEVARISTDWGQQVSDLQQTQKAETGTTSRNLAYLQQGGTSASAQAYLNSLEQSHASEVTTMLAKRDNAIAVAEQAYSDKNFQLSDKMMQEAKDLEQTVYQRNQDYLDNTLKIKSEQRAQLEFDQKQQTDARDFALDQGINQQFYDIGGVAYRTSDGKAYHDMNEFIAAGGDPSYKNVFVVQPGSKEAKAYVQDLATKYPDAGISLKDDPTTAAAKIKNSRIYQEQVRPPKSGGGGMSMGDQVKLSFNGDVQGLVNSWQNAGFLNSGYIGSGQYKTAKSQFVSKYSGLMDDPGKMFDQTLSVYVNSSNKGLNNTNSYKDDYGLN